VERKLATVLFVDLVDSTGLVSGVDPEVARGRVTRFLDHVGECVEAHGGTVGRFAGDAIMAAFGIPQAHEDDAARAVRAGLAILDAVEQLGVEARIGVESGEVVSDESDLTFATGEPINVAVRLQQAAGPNELLIGPNTHRLTLGTIEAEDLGPVELRGIERPVWARRAVGTMPEAAPIRISAPLVGRDEELDLLHNTFSRVARDERAHLFTIYGEPGVGKSRLAREFLEGLEGATVLSGRALPYGEGITYWPLAEMVKVAAGITDDLPVSEAFQKLRDCCEDEAVADLLGLASGVLEAVEGERSRQEIAWAVREWAEKLAGVQPLVLVFEDVHWAEEPLLDLVEHLASWVREAPLLLICLARPELLDFRPGWSGGRVRATAIELEPLAPQDSHELIQALLEDLPPFDGDLIGLIEKTGGNPLFVEETVRMLAEQDGGAATDRIPDTVQALIAARIDRLPTVEKRVLQRGAVVGRTFWAGAIAHLSPDLDGLDDAFESLLLRDFLLREARSSIGGETAYRFKHVLIREVAYGGLSKSERAEHHMRFAAWLRERAGDELIEVRAYHLDHAATLLAELEGAPPEELASEAAEVLEEAGRRALAREGFRTARELLVRAVEIEPTLQRRWLAGRAALRLNDWPAVAGEMKAVLEAARAEQNRQIEGRSLTALAQVALYRDADVDGARALVDEALQALEDVDHPESQYEAIIVRAELANMVGDLDEVERHQRRLLEIAQAAGRKDLEANVTRALGEIHSQRRELDAATPLIERALELADESGARLVHAQTLHSLAALREMAGDSDAAIELHAQGRREFEEIGAAAGIAYSLSHLGRLAYERGDLGEAERHLRAAIKQLQQLDDRAFLCEAERRLAQVLAAQGRVDEAERYALEALETVGAQDAFSQISTKTALGVVRAAQGRDEEAERLLREAAEEMIASPYRSAEDQALRPLVEFLHSRGRAGEAARYEERLAVFGPAVSAAKIA
jgi:class 3 adenylate cyclase/tetratricopeptide (TPR) repeat protein